MQRDIQIGTQMVPMRATAATAYRYRQAFHGDLLTELAKEKPEQENVEIFQRMAYIMNKSAIGADMNMLNIEGYVDWLEKFEALELIEALPQVVGLYMESKTGTSAAKKNKNQ